MYFFRKFKYIKTVCIKYFFIKLNKIDLLVTESPVFFSDMYILVIWEWKKLKEKLNHPKKSAIMFWKTLFLIFLLRTPKKTLHIINYIIIEVGYIYRELYVETITTGILDKHNRFYMLLMFVSIFCAKIFQEVYFQINCPVGTRIYGKIKKKKIEKKVRLHKIQIPFLSKEERLKKKQDKEEKENKVRNMYAEELNLTEIDSLIDKYMYKSAFKKKKRK